jgi:ketosteroid isomerase-like protein
MRTKLPDVISAYVEASNSRDAERFGTLFTKGAVVHDEGQDHRGVAAIKKWLAATAKKYAFTLTPIRLSRKEGEVVLTVKMTGDFPGSPISTRFRFVLNQGKIAKLDIRA